MHIRRHILGLFVVLVAVLSAGAGFAHFKLNLNVRIFHVVHTDTGVEIFLRTPMAYVVADKLGPIGDDGRPTPAPFTTNRVENGVLMHLVDGASIRSDPRGLASLIAEELRIGSDGNVLVPEIVGLNVHPVGSEPDFATRAEAERAMETGTAFPLHAGDVYVGDAVVDVRLRYPQPLEGAYELSMSVDPGLPGQEDTANLVLDYRKDVVRTYRATGLLETPIIVAGSAAGAALGFVIEGIRHIIEGVDHVLFVLCMVIGALSLRALLFRVTGFTVGHTVTLIMGFFGFAPSAPWFIPAIETVIALSIILAAADAVYQRIDRPRSNGSAVAMTAGIGLLHGFGFSFMLREILRVDAANVWQSLLAFNVGVEIGQLLIVVIVWPVVVLLRRMPASVWINARGAVALSVSVLAAVWAVERVSGLLV